MAKTSGIGCVLAGLLAAGAVGALGGCSSDSTTSIPSFASNPPPSNVPDYKPVAPSRPVLFDGKAERASAKVAPIAGGTLLVTADGHALASDPDRDLVHIVDLAKKLVVSVTLQEGDEPGRIVAGPAGTAYALARRGGVVLAIDIVKGVARRIPVCAAPRGIVYEPTQSKVYVACRSGVLAVLDAATEALGARYRLAPDLRDVAISGDALVVTRFKSAEVLLVSYEGEVLRRSQPQVSNLFGISATPGVAFRALALPQGGVLVGHVESSDSVLPSGAGAYYGNACGGSVVDPALTVLDPYGGADGRTFATVASNSLGGVSGPLDVAITANGQRIAVLASGNSWLVPTVATPPNLWITNLDQVKGGRLATGCAGAGSNVSAVVPGEPVAVAFDAAGQWVVQSREPAQLQLERGGTISLAPDSRFDTGLAMFHMNTGGGIACTSCHPEAGEDGHTWNFSVGPRRSQTLEGGLSGRAPFHWTGDLNDFDALVDEVMLKRMSLPADVSGDQRGALRAWLDTVPSAATADDLDPGAVERGQALFKDSKLACATCHSGPEYTDNKLHDVGTSGEFITPSLLDVNVRAPLFHDGCAVDLEGRFGSCGGGDKHGVTSQLSKADEGDLLAFMRSL